MSSTRRPRVVEAVLLALLVLAVAWVLQIRRQRPAPAGPVAFGPGPGFGLPSRITVPSGRDSIVVVRDGDRFVVVHPLDDRADPLFVAEMLRRVAELKAERVLGPGSGAAYGLDGPGPELRMTSSTGHAWTLRLGTEAPAGSLVYARVDGPASPVILLDRFTVQKYFLPKLKTLRDPTPTDLRPGPLDSVAVLVPGRELRASRLDRDLWRARVPARLDLDPMAMSGVIRLLREPTILDFPALPLNALGLDPPRAAWVLSQGSRHDTVWVGHGTPDQQGVYVRPAHRRLPAILPSERFRSLVDGWPALADRHLLRLPIDSVTVVEFPGRPLSLRREEGTWRRYPGGSALSRGAALGQDLANLASLRWTGFPWPEEPPPRNAGRLAVRLATPSAAETLVLAAPADTLAWARATRAPRWGRVSASAWITWSYRAAHGE
jgi:hypothetical protein